MDAARRGGAADAVLDSIGHERGGSCVVVAVQRFGSWFPRLRVGSRACGFPEPSHEQPLMVVTGGPGASKTAATTATRSFCEHVAILPEAAAIVFGKGFPRGGTAVGL